MDKKRNALPPGVRIRSNKISLFFKEKERKNYTTQALDWPDNATNLKRAAALVSTIREEIRHGIFDYGEHFPDSPRAAGNVACFRDYAQSYLNNPQSNWKPQSRDKFLRILNTVWMPGLEHKKIHLVRYRDLADTLAAALARFETKNDKAPSESYYNDWLICVRGVFEMAILDQAISRNTNPAGELKNKKRIKTLPDPFDQEEANLIIDAAYKQYGDIWGAWFELGFFTGLRYPSEPSALLWADVDLRKKQIKVDKIRSRKKIQYTTKTNKARTVYLNDRALHALEMLKPHTFLQDSFLFITEKGQPVITGDPQRKMWKFLLKKLGIRYRDNYNMRHTYATFGLNIGNNPAFMADQLGHATEEFFNTYSTWINSTQNQAQMDLMNQALGTTNKGKHSRNNND